MSDRLSWITKNIIRGGTAVAIGASAWSCYNGNASSETQPLNRGNSTEIDPTQTEFAKITSATFESVVNSETKQSIINSLPENRPQSNGVEDVFSLKVGDKKFNFVMYELTDEEINNGVTIENSEGIKTVQSVATYTEIEGYDGVKSWVRLIGITSKPDDPSIVWFYDSNGFPTEEREIDTKRAVFGYSINSKDNILYQPLITVPTSIPGYDYTQALPVILNGEIPVAMKVQAMLLRPEVQPSESILTNNALENGKWGNYTFIENSNGYYEMKDSQGNLIPDVKLFRDGTAELTHKINGKAENLYIAFQAIHVTKEKLIMGLWDYDSENKAWSGVNTKSSTEMVNNVETGENDPYKLVILRGHEKEKKMTETMFLARDEAMTQEVMRAEFEDITVEYNFQEYNTSEDFNKLVVPARWEIDNYSRESQANGGPAKTTGIYKLTPYSKDATLGYNGKLSPISPQQIGLEEGWFNVEMHSLSPEGKWELRAKAIHLPFVLVNPDGTFMAVSSMGTEDLILKRLDGFLTKATRDGAPVELETDEIIAGFHHGVVVISDPDTRNFVVSVNLTALENFNLPELDHPLTYKTKLPEVLKKLIFFT